MNEELEQQKTRAYLQILKLDIIQCNIELDELRDEIKTIKIKMGC